MVITVDKFTAVKMYDKVQRLWKEEIKSLRGKIKKSKDEIGNARRKKIIDYMHKVEMAVVGQRRERRSGEVDSKTSIFTRTASAWIRWTSTGMISSTTSKTPSILCSLCLSAPCG